MSAANTPALVGRRRPLSLALSHASPSSSSPSSAAAAAVGRRRARVARGSQCGGELALLEQTWLGLRLRLRLW